MKFGFDPLFDLPLGFRSRNHLPVLRVAEPPIRRIQLFRSDVPHRIGNYHVFDERTHGVAFQQQIPHALVLFLRTGDLTVIPDQLLSAFQGPVQDPRAFFFQQHLREIGDFVLDRLAVVFDPPHTAIPCCIIGVDIDCKSRIRRDDHVENPLNGKGLILALRFSCLRIPADQSLEHMGPLGHQEVGFHIDCGQQCLVQHPK